MAGRADRWDYACAAVLGAITIVSRLPYRAHMLYNWDAVQFALALREYDIVKHQPHPPGYVLYVGLGRLVEAWVKDPAAAYVVLAVIFSGLTTFVVYLLGRLAYDRSTALTAATLLAVSPLFWFYGSVGLTYAGEALFASIVAYFSFRALRGSRADAWLAAAYLGLAGGMRQSILILLFPLWLCAVAVGTRSVRTIAIGFGVLTIAVLTWFVPMIWLTGGLERYVEASIDLAESVVKPTSIVAGPFETTLRMSRYLLESVLVGLGPLALAGALVPSYVRRHGWGRREWLLVAWVVPPVLVYTLVHFGQAGYVLTFLPALVIFLSRVMLASLGRPQALASRPAVRAALAAVVITAFVTVNGSFFVNARPLPRDFDTPKPAWRQMAEDEAYDWVFSRTAAALREHEAVVRTFVDAIRGLYAPEDTVVIAELGNPRSYPWLRHAMYYLPEYTIYELRVGDLPPGYYAPRLSSAMIRFADSEIHVPSAARRLVWFVDHWSPTSERPAELEEIELPYGRYLYVLPLRSRTLEYAGYTFVTDEPPPARTASRGTSDRPGVRTAR
jgi:dolichyl-phosphate-mannose-protein mannosyltransferase